MTFVRVKPIKEFDNLHNSIQKYFDDFTSTESSLNNPEFSPKVDISESNNQLKIEAEVPGVNKEDLKITLQDNILTIEGEKKNLSKDEEKEYFVTERTFGSFKRNIALPEDIDSDKVNAKFERGVLSISISKIEEKAPVEKVINVK